GFGFEYGRMDVQGTGGQPAIVGYSAGGLAPGSVGESNVGELGRGAVVGNGTQTALFEFFSTGDFDLRAEGSGPLATTPATQPDLNREYLAFVGRSCSAPPAAVLPKLTLALGKSNLHPGQTLTLSATLTPGTAPGPVTAFIVIQTPTGQFFSLTGAGFVPGIAPAASL